MGEVNDWDSISRSGIAASLNLGEGLMIDQFKCKVFSDFQCSGVGDAKWDFSKESWQPDVITINLGTNDYTFGSPTKESFQKSYQELVAFVRSVYPKSLLFCILPLEFSLL